MAEYYGVDWVAMVLTLTAIYLLGNKSRYGFITMMGGNSCWVALGILTGSLGLIAANVVFLFMNLRGYLKWGQDDS
ncbi:hypothetical protein GCM10011403_28670 [Pseudohongiella nitratireducens]|uniref:PnuC protein n=1 Tax=Pseudohongiella nitratireducens TaxID=1768907 RepID=A0A916QNE1_9GAMM|nr:YgjV family protein [Pseudohongiella nitratireducens]GFZ83330.1 hypothetical protein GCM10011403_28670 [Pseudohongiella nitratireducens]